MRMKFPSSVAILTVGRVDLTVTHSANKFVFSNGDEDKYLVHMQQSGIKIHNYIQVNYFDKTNKSILCIYNSYMQLF